MINLIPKNEKRSILIEYWVRVISVWFILWSVALFVGVFILMPSYVLISSQVSAYEMSAIEASEKVEDYNSVSTALIEASKQAKTIVDEASIPVFSDYIDLFESKQGPGIQVSQIFLSRNEEGMDPVELIGVASDRQTLASFRDRLLEDEQIVSVDLPISNLARDINIQFTLTVILSNEDSV